MFKHVDYVQFQAKPEKPDAFFAAKLQELVGSQFGEMTVMMQYLWQGCSCRVPGKYKGYQSERVKAAAQAIYEEVKK